MRAPTYVELTCLALVLAYAGMAGTWFCLVHRINNRWAVPVSLACWAGGIALATVFYVPLCWRAIP